MTAVAKLDARHPLPDHREEGEGVVAEDLGDPDAREAGVGHRLGPLGDDGELLGRVEVDADAHGTSLGDPGERPGPGGRAAWLVCRGVSSQPTLPPAVGRSR
jgi:hypothetical protein